MEDVEKHVLERPPLAFGPGRRPGASPEVVAAAAGDDEGAGPALPARVQAILRHADLLATEVVEGVDLGAPLAADELRIRYRLRADQVKFATNAYFFQEGHAKYYERARYGEFRVAPDGECLLTGMRGANLEALGALLQAEKSDPRFEMTYVYRGNIYEVGGDRPAAAREYQRALEINSGNQAAREALGRVSR